MVKNKIGIICTFMNSYGGVQTCVLSLIKGLNQNGITPILIADKIPNTKLWKEMGLDCEYKVVKYTIKQTTYQRFRKYLYFFEDWFYFLRTSSMPGKYDFLFIFEPNVIVEDKQPHLFYLSNSPIAKGFSPYPTLSKFKILIFNLFVKRIVPLYDFKNYNAVINSKFTAEHFYKSFGKSIDIIYPSNSIGDNPQVKSFVKENSVVFLSRINRNKKPHILIDLANNHRDIKFKIIGVNEDEFYLNEINLKIKSCQLQNVEIITNASREMVLRELAKAKYYIFTAENEHFGITTVEAILFECLPLVHDSGGQIEIVPFDELRFAYNNLNEQFENLLKFSDLERKYFVMQLKKNVDNFSEKQFILSILEKMRDHIEIN